MSQYSKEQWREYRRRKSNNTYELKRRDERRTLTKIRVSRGRLTVNGVKP